jgi:hypothetical protein
MAARERALPAVSTAIARRCRETAVQHGAGAIDPSSSFARRCIARSPVMNTQSHQSSFELRFQSLFNEGRALAFPCDAKGHVSLDALSERARSNYFFARGMVGRDFATPAVLPATLH